MLSSRLSRASLLNGLIIGGDNKLTLTGLTTYGEAFSGTDWVRVINILPRGR